MSVAAADISDMKTQLQNLSNAVNVAHARLDKQRDVIRTLESRVQFMENGLKQLIRPMNPYNITFLNGILTFTLNNADFMEFVDIQIDDAIWVQFWAQWTDRPIKFTVNKNVVTVDLSAQTVKNNLKIFSRYDCYTGTSAAGFANYAL
jgi:hypothetical protein